MTRQKKTPAQRAQEAYDVACRLADRMQAKYVDAQAELGKLADEAAAAVKRRDYLAQHPDLPKQAAQPIAAPEPEVIPVSPEAKAARAKTAKTPKAGDPL